MIFIICKAYQVWTAENTTEKCPLILPLTYRTTGPHYVHRQLPEKILIIAHEAWLSGEWIEMSWWKLWHRENMTWQTQDDKSIKGCLWRQCCISMCARLYVHTFIIRVSYSETFYTIGVVLTYYPLNSQFSHWTSNSISQQFAILIPI